MFEYLTPGRVVIIALLLAMHDWKVFLYFGFWLMLSKLGTHDQDFRRRK